MAIQVEAERRELAAADESQDYRALSSSAVIGAVFALVSAMSVLAALTSIDAWLVMVPLPITGLALSIYAWRKIAQQPDQYTGKMLAVGGTLLATVVFFAGMGTAVYVYATEKPDGYDRINFVEMKPDAMEEATGQPVPPDIMAYDGKPIFIKGYMRPSSQRYGLNQFLLVRDNQECCFGDLSKVKYYDQMQVHLTDDERTNYSTRIFRVGGVLKIDPTAAASGSGRPVFTLVANYLK